MEKSQAKVSAVNRDDRAFKNRLRKAVFKWQKKQWEKYRIWRGLGRMEEE